MMNPNYSPDPPTILCKYIEYWRGLYTKCCCVMHENCLGVSESGSCTCPRCCFCIHLPRLDPLRCFNCKRKVNRYQVCKHRRGEIGFFERCEEWRASMMYNKKNQQKTN